MQETVSELIGKPLLTKSGEYLGCVKSVQTDARYGRIRNFACFDRDEEDFLLPASAIAQFGQDALVVQYAARRACKNCVPLPLKCKTYSQSGDELGAIDDFLRSGTELTGVVLSNGQAYPLERLVKVTDVAVLDLSDPFVPPKTRKAPAQKSAPPAKERARECAAAALPDAETVGEQPHAAQAARYEEVASLRETAAAVAEESGEREEGAAPPDAVAEQLHRPTQKRSGNSRTRRRLPRRRRAGVRGPPCARERTSDRENFARRPRGCARQRARPCRHARNGRRHPPRHGA